MIIEIFSKTTPGIRDVDGNEVNNPPRWYWHFRSKGRITADAEVFPSKGNAVRAAKAVVKAIAKSLGAGIPVFGPVEATKSPTVFIIRFGK